MISAGRAWGPVARCVRIGREWLYNVLMCALQGSNMKEVDDLVPGLEVIDWV